MEFKKDTHIWELTEDIELDAPRQNPQVSFLSEFLRGLDAFDGTATKLSELLEQATGEKMLPAALSKTLVRFASELDKAGIHVTSNRTRDSRLLHIVCDGSDGNDSKSGC